LVFAVSDEAESRMERCGAVEMTKAKRKPYRALRYGIQNHYGEVWTSETFQTPEKAQKYLDKQRPLYGGLTKKHKVVLVRIAVRLAGGVVARQFNATRR
jgi:hypothetical protein